MCFVGKVHFYFFEFFSSVVIDISFSVNLPTEDLPLIVSLSLKYVPTITIAVKPSAVIHINANAVTVSLKSSPPLLSY